MEAIEELSKAVNSDAGGSFRLTGIAMQYLQICERELWFYFSGVEIDRDTQSIARGEWVDNNSYPQKDATTRVIDGLIAPDFVDEDTIVEVKPSSAITDGAEHQLKYYLWYLDKFKDATFDGVLAIPSERKRIDVTLSDEVVREVEADIQRAYTVHQMDEPPEYVEKPFCDSCAYNDFCQI